MSQPTDPLASGASTPEGKLSIFGAIAGVVIAILAALQPMIQQAADANPNNIWFHLVLAVAGLALTGASTWSFTKSQTLVKGGILDVLQEGAVAIAPGLFAMVLSKYLKPATSVATPVSTTAAAVVAQLQKPSVGGAAALTAAGVTSSSPTPVIGTPVARP